MVVVEGIGPLTGPGLTRRAGRCLSGGKPWIFWGSDAEMPEENSYFKTDLDRGGRVLLLLLLSSSSSSVIKQRNNQTSLSVSKTHYCTSALAHWHRYST
jgi:hypothetical protein